MRLIAEGMPASLPAMGVANATTPREARLLSRLDRIALDMRAWPVEGPVLFFIGQVVSLYAAEGMAIPDLAMHLNAAAGA
jgi:uroporphyrin-III C-methyltransferase